MSPIILKFQVMYIIYITISFLIASSKAECNLLQSSNTQYIDTESKSSILSMCDKDTDTLSLWEQYQCDFIQNRDGYQKCWPQRRMSNCDPGSLKGAIFFYHGYSACPDQYNVVASKLQHECYDVYLILTLGHGFTPCNSSNTSCIESRWNLTAMPTNRQPYIDYVQNMLAAIEDEVSIIKECELSANSAFTSDDLEVVIGGLSFGAPLSAATVAFSGSDSVFTKQILMSPFFGVSSGAADNLLHKCFLNQASFTECLPLYFQNMGFDIGGNQSEALTNMVLEAISAFVDLDFLDTSYETSNVLLRKVLEWIVENPDAIDNDAIKQQIDAVLTGVISWGDQCLLDVAERDRGGFCQFETRNLLAAHSFANYLVDTVRDLDRDSSVETLLILVERDGATRNSLITNYIQRYYDYNDDLLDAASSCMWLISLECQSNDYQGSVDNTCGVPHSAMAEADNLGIEPYNMWWAESYQQGIISWINGDTFEDGFMETDPWDTTRNECVSVGVANPPTALIADVPSVLSISVNVLKEDITDKAKETMLDGLSNLLGVKRGVLELTFNFVGSANAASDIVDDYFAFLVDLNPEAVRLITTLLDMGLFRKIGNYSVVYAEIEGNEYYVEDQMTTPSPTNGSNRRMLSSWMIVMGAYVLTLFV